jgi:FKBP-type peptidyl-prolyl cis-trans isomerase (trigger factor)
MRGSLKINLIIVSLLFAICITSFSSCKKEDVISVSEMSLEELEKSVSLCDYKGLELSLGAQTKEEALLTYIDENSNIKKYPSGSVEYYSNQLKSQYRYYADQADMKYEEMLDKLGEDNVTINAEAKRLVKKDLIFELIRKKESIVLTEAEKTQFFDRYVKKYAESYKYSEEYVRGELSELVYDSMLYDKTVEFLIINNSFVE